MSLDGNQYYFITYDYDTNYIFAELIADLRDEIIIRVFEKVSGELTKKGYTAAFDVTGNHATTPIKAYLKKKHWRWQFVEPSNHRVNVAK